MDQFLPGDIAVMVLRYLASSGCESTVFAMIEEMPLLKFYVPGQPPGVAKMDYLRILGRPCLSPGLLDILNDYGNAKMLVTEIVQKEKPAGSPMRQCDSLVTQLKQLSNILATLSATMKTDVQLLKQKVLDVGTNTDAVEAEEKTDPVKVTLDNETQTDFPKIDLESGDSLDVPLMFYNTLMSDSSLQQKLAMVINENMTDSANSKNDKLQKVCSKAETEIDRFLVDLLKDVPPDEDIGTFSGNLLFPVMNDPAINDVENNLYNLFQDEDSIMKDHVIPVDQLNQFEENEAHNGGKPISSETPTIPNAAEENIIEDVQRRKEPPIVAKKRIIPIPAPITKANPVFEKVQVERCVGPEGHTYSVNLEVPITSEWQKLGRRPIVPKVPSSPVIVSMPLEHASTSMAQPLEPPRQNKPPLSANKRKAKLTTPVKMTPEKAKNSDLNFFHIYHEPHKLSTSAASTPNNTHCVNKSRSPDKQKLNSETPQVAILSAQPTLLHLRSDQTPAETPNNTEQTCVMAKINNNAEVTPVLDAPSSVNVLPSPSSTPAYISPRLRRLVCSAQKIRATSTQVTLSRKSFSTPRKKKHVRSLFFTTPPSLKNKQKLPTPPCSPSSQKVTNAHGVSISLPQKRKLETLEENQPKSKKRLWSEDTTTYKSAAFPDRNFSSERMNESMILSAKKVFKSRKNRLNDDKDLISHQVAPTLSSVQNSKKSRGTLNGDDGANIVLKENTKKLNLGYRFLPEIAEESASELTHRLSPQKSPSSDIFVDGPPKTIKNVSFLPTLVAVSSLMDSSSYNLPLNNLPPSLSHLPSENCLPPLPPENRLPPLPPENILPTLHLSPKSSPKNLPLPLPAPPTNRPTSLPPPSPPKNLPPALPPPPENLPPPLPPSPPENLPPPLPPENSPRSLPPLPPENSLRSLPPLPPENSPRSLPPFPPESSPRSLPPLPQENSPPSLLSLPPDKSSSSIYSSPISTCPRTPRYLVNEPDTDSNSTCGSYKFTERLYHCTPSKFLAPPPTPGRNIFLDERSQSSLPGYMELLGNNSSVIKQSFMAPLDLSSPLKSQPLIVITPPVSVKQKPNDRQDSENTNTKTVVAKMLNITGTQSSKSSSCADSGNDQFQVPKGVPKKTSPPASITAKKTSCSSFTKVVSKEEKSSQPSGTVSNFSNSSEQQSTKIHGLSSPGMRFTVSGATRKLTMTGTQKLVTLVEIGKRINNLQNKPPTVANLPPAVQTNREPSRLRDLLNNVDLNNFLSNVVHKVDKFPEIPEEAVQQNDKSRLHIRIKSINDQSRKKKKLSEVFPNLTKEYKNGDDTDSENEDDNMDFEESQSVLNIVDDSKLEFPLLTQVENYFAQETSNY